VNNLILEVLYPEYMNLYGDTGNINYLKQCLPNLKVIYTSFHQKPAFLTKKIAMLYLGPMTENSQELIAEKLYPYKKEIKDLIKNNIFVLATGNAFELFGKYIEKQNKEQFKGLGLYNFYTIRFNHLRYNENTIGIFNNLEIVGFKNQLSFSYGKITKPFLKITKGTGINKESKLEGIKDHNFYGTYLLGPLLVNNPFLSKKIFEDLNIKYQLPYFVDSLKAYNKRIDDIKKEK
jgi:hypothetical protein